MRTRNICGLMCTVLISFVLVFVCVWFVPMEVKAEDAYPWADHTPVSKGYDPYGFVYQNCTSYCAWRLNMNGIAFHNNYKGVEWGNAKNWGNAAKSVGIPVDMNPQVGDIGYKTSGDYGHVAYVAAVNGNKVTCEQYNMNSDHKYHNKTENITSFAGFIHFGGTPRQLVNLGADFYACIAASGANEWSIIENRGGNVQISAVGNDLSSANQQWHFVRQSDGSYHIISVYDGRYLNADRMDTAGTNISAASYMNWDGQKWYIIRNGNWYRIVAKYNMNLSLDVTNVIFSGGTNIQLWNNNDGQGQFFDIYKYDMNQYPLVENMGEDFYAGIAASGANEWSLLENRGGNVQISSVGNDLVSANQQWHFVRQYDGSYHITSVYDGRYLNADRMDTAGTNISVASYMNWDGQKWYIIRNGSWYRIVPKYNMNLSLDVTNVNFSGGTNIQLWNNNDGQGQFFDIYKYDMNQYPLVENMGDDFYASIAASGSGKWSLIENYAGNVQINSVGNDLSNTRQQWHFIRQQDGSYNIISVQDGNYLNADSIDTSGSNILTTTVTSGNEPKWYIIRCNDWFVIAPKKNLNLCLDLEESNYAGGTNIRLWDKNGNETQLFDVYKNELAPGHVHSLIKVPAKKAKCLEDGNRRYWKCSECEKMFSDDQGLREITEIPVIAATGHTEVTDPAVPATYDSTGLTEGSHCSVCGAVIRKQEVVPKKVKSGWIRENGKWYYYVKGTKHTGWGRISKKWYYFDASGVMQTGWQKIEGTWYYFTSKGVRYSGWLTTKKGDTYYLDEGGVPVTGKQEIDGKVYYFNSKYVMTVGWLTKSGKTFYFNVDGTMQTGWTKIDGKWYRFSGKGVMLTGWTTYKGNKYYLDENGVLAVNCTLTIDGVEYTFDKSGVCVSP